MFAWQLYGEIIYALNGLLWSLITRQLFRLYAISFREKAGFPS